jgi:hypothetical protein
MFCHEGPWHKVDRIWTIRTDGSDLKLIHQRTMIMEIAGHEFWSADGKTIWYDLQTPRGEDFWVAGYEIATGKRGPGIICSATNGACISTSRPTAKLFSSDGGDDKMVAHADNGKWLYLFHPELIDNRSAEGNINTSKLIQTGVFHSEKLVNMSKHDYALEPNAMFSPDMKWLIFRSNMSGANQAYAVELKRADGKPGYQESSSFPYATTFFAAGCAGFAPFGGVGGAVVIGQVGHHHLVAHHIGLGRAISPLTRVRKLTEKELFCATNPAGFPSRF